MLQVLDWYGEVCVLRYEWKCRCERYCALRYGDLCFAVRWWMEKRQWGDRCDTLVWRCNGGGLWN